MVKGETHLQVFHDNAQLRVPEEPLTELCFFTPKQGVFQDPKSSPGLNLSELLSQEASIPGTQVSLQLCQEQTGTMDPGKT